MSRTKAAALENSSPVSLAPRFSPVTLITAAALLLAAGIAWAWLLSSPMQVGGASVAGTAMQPEPLSAAYLIAAFAMWSMMMVAMMVPSAAPVMLLHARIDRATSRSARLTHTLLFGFGYLLVWTGFSAAAAIAQTALVATGAISAAALSLGSRSLVAALLLIAAFYEITAAKRACLQGCQSPLVFIHRHWRPGAKDALRLGFVHGLYCLGCCWALMLLLFAGGIMNLAWVALLGIVVLGEKLTPRQWQLSRFVAGALFVAAIVVVTG